MTMSNFAATKAKLQREMDKLKKQMEQLEKKNRQPAIESILRTMQEFDITPEEITQAFSKGRRGSGARKTTTRRSVVKPKYRNEATGDTWTGRGRTPLWLVAEEEAGRHRDEFLIEKPADAKPAATEKPAAQQAEPSAKQEDAAKAEQTTQSESPELELPAPTYALPGNLGND